MLKRLYDLVDMFRRNRELVGLLEDAGRLLRAQEAALVELNERAEQAEATNHQNMAVLLTLAGGEVTISRDVLESVRNANTRIDAMPNRKDGSVTVRLVIEPDKPDADFVEDEQ
jgi:hypothetical protein